MPTWTMHEYLRLKLWESLERFDLQLAARVTRLAQQAGVPPAQYLPILLADALCDREGLRQPPEEGPGGPAPSQTRNGEAS